MSFAANPRANQGDTSSVPQEAGGAVTSDSLAAESISAGGEFSKNTNTQNLDVKGSNSTFNTTDDSAASVLPPARDGAEREDRNDMGLGSDEKGVTGAKLDTLGDPNFTGVHSREGYVGGPSGNSGQGDYSSGSGASGDTGDSFADGGSNKPYTTGGGADTSSGYGQQDTTSTNTGSGSRSGNTDTADRYDADNDAPIRTGRAGEAYGTSSAYNDSETAPNYAGTVSGAITSEGQYKPKGDNLTEGGIPETKTFTGNVGGSKDPGRLAEQDFNKMNAGGTISAGEQSYGGGGSGSTGGAFDVLQSERAPDVEQ